jgi:hypothetical protein
MREAKDLKVPWGKTCIACGRMATAKVGDTQYAGSTESRCRRLTARFSVSTIAGQGSDQPTPPGA